MELLLLIPSASMHLLFRAVNARLCPEASIVRNGKRSRLGTRYEHASIGIYSKHSNPSQSHLVVHSILELRHSIAQVFASHLAHISTMDHWVSWGGIIRRKFNNEHLDLRRTVIERVIERDLPNEVLGLIFEKVLEHNMLGLHDAQQDAAAAAINHCLCGVESPELHPIATRAYWDANVFRLHYRELRSKAQDPHLPIKHVVVDARVDLKTYKRESQRAARHGFRRRLTTEDQFRVSFTAELPKMGFLLGTPNSRLTKLKTLIIHLGFVYNRKCPEEASSGRQIAKIDYLQYPGMMALCAAFVAMLQTIKALRAGLKVGILMTIQNQDESENWEDCRNETPTEVAEKLLSRSGRGYWL